MLNALNLYCMIVIRGIQQFATYRTNIFTGIITALFALGARYALWLALFATGNARDTTLEETMTYFVILGILMVWSAGFSNYSNRIGNDIRSGDIAQGLIRPRSYHFQVIAGMHTGAIIEILTGSIPTLIVAAVFINLLLPASFMAFIAFILSVAFGAVIYILIDLTISYSAFWLIDHWYTSWYRGALFMLFGGTALPLWFYPQWLLTFSNLLPFRLAFFSPMEIYLGRIYGTNMLVILAMQVVWIGLLFAIERFVWSRVQYKIVVQGG